MWEFRDEILRRVKDFPVNSLYIVSRSGGVTTIQPGKEGEFRDWEMQNGCFRKYSLDPEEWDKGDEQKFLHIERAVSVMFYVKTNRNAKEMTVYPPRHLCV